jgi:hypothetical protein
MRSVRFFESLNFFVGQAQGERSYGILKVVRFAGADDRRCNGRLGKQPRQRQLRTGNTALLCDLAETINNLVVGLLRF